MAEQRSKRLAVVLMLAEKEEQAAAARLGEQQGALEGEQQQLAQLEDYREQYVLDYKQLRTGATPQALMSYSGFLQRLSEAVAGQEQRLIQVRQLVELRRAEWQEKYHRRRSMQELIERLKREEDSVQEQRLQRELDDMAAQRFSREARKD